jgi:hypothetical protein
MSAEKKTLYERLVAAIGENDCREYPTLAKAAERGPMAEAPGNLGEHLATPGFFAGYSTLERFGAGWERDGAC